MQLNFNLENTNRPRLSVTLRQRTNTKAQLTVPLHY